MEKDTHSRPESTLIGRSSSQSNRLHPQLVDISRENSKIWTESDNVSTTESRLSASDILNATATSSKAPSVSNLSEFSLDNPVLSGMLCSPCLRVNKKVTAIKYCVVCAENLCKPCLRNHIKYNTAKQHKLIGPDETFDFVQTSPYVTETGIEKCSKHGDQDLNNFCEQHKVLCCDKCAYLEHGACDQIIDLITATRDMDLVMETKIMQDELARLIDLLKKLKSKRQEDQVRLRKNTAKSLGAIRDLRQRINEVFDRLERQPIDVINSTCLEEDDQIIKDVRETNQLLEQLQECNVKLKSNIRSDIGKFAVLQKSKAVVRNANHMENIFSKRTGKNYNNFVVNNKVLKAISNIKSIGECRSDSVDEIHVSFDRLLNVYTADESSSEIPNILTCDIQGLTTVADGRIIVADYEIKQLIVFSKDFKFERKLRLGKDGSDTSVPFALCRTGEFEVAVSMERDKVVDIVDLQGQDDDVDIATEIKIGEYCRGIAYSFITGELFVACGGGSYKDEGLGHIRVYDVQGNHLRSLKRCSTTGNLLVPRPLNIALSQDGTTVYVTDCDKSIAIFDRHGENIVYIQRPDLQEPRGICVDWLGRVMVTCQQSHRILQVLREDQNVKILVSETDLLKFPNALCFDEKQCRLIVSMYSKPLLAVFKIH